MEKNLRSSSVKLPRFRFLKWARLLRAACLKNRKEQQQQEVDEDLISSLPDDILHTILSKLPIRDAAVTTAVSKRWAPLFPTLPSLNIEASTFNSVSVNLKMYNQVGLGRPYVADIDEWVKALSSVVNSRKAPVKKFEIAVEIIGHRHCDFDEVFRNLCVAGLQELVITNYDYTQFYEIPWPFFSCHTIVKLEIMPFCRLVVPSKLTGLGSVKLLVLSNVSVTDDDLERLISWCRAIEKLIITDCFKVNNIVISAPSLSELEISVCKPVGISLESSPRLASVTVSFAFDYYFWSRYGLPEERNVGHFSAHEHFSLSDSETEFEMEFVGTNETTNLLAFLKGLCGIKDLRLDFNNEYHTVLAEEGVAIPPSLPPECYLVELKKLRLSWRFNYNTFNAILSCLLNSSPHLMEIIICVDTFTYKYEYYPTAMELDFWGKQLPPDCVKHHLTAATFYLDDNISDDWFSFPKFLLLNAELLKRMEIFYKGSENAEKIKNELLAVQMASPGAEIMIKPLISRYMHISNF